MSSGYSRSVTITGAKPMSEWWAPRSGLKHRLLMLWPAYRRADARRAHLRGLILGTRSLVDLAQRYQNAMSDAGER